MTALQHPDHHLPPLHRLHQAVHALFISAPLSQRQTAHCDHRLSHFGQHLGNRLHLYWVFVCSPRSYAWESWDGEHQGTCLNQSAIVVSHAIENIIFDVFIIALPLPVLWKLKLSLPKKLGVCLMFLIGLVYVNLSRKLIN